MAGEEGEVQKCGDFTFPVTIKSEQGHQWLPPEEKGVADTRENSPAQLIKFLPNFTKGELDEVDDAQRKEYWTRQNTEEEEEEKPLEEKKVKMRDALAELEKLPRKNGEWIKGEVRELGNTREKTVKMPSERKLLIEEAPDAMVRELFEEKLNLENNAYIKQFPEKIQREMRKELIDMLMEQRGAFSGGEEGNHFAEQIGQCDWFEYQLVLKPAYRDTIFYQKPKALSREDTEALKNLLEDWTGKGLIRKKQSYGGEARLSPLPPPLSGQEENNVGVGDGP